MQTLKINHTEFDPSKILDSPFVPKKSQARNDPATGKPVAQTSFDVMDIQYEYDVYDKQGNKTTSVGPFYVELCEVISPKGIEVKPNLNGVDTPSLFCTFDLREPDAYECVKHGIEGDISTAGFFKKLYNVLALRLLTPEAKKVSSLKSMKTLEGISGVFKYEKTMVYEPLDSVTGEPIEGKNPSKFFNLVNQGKPGTFARKETIFNAPCRDDKTGDFVIIPWDVLLAGVEMKHKPLLWIKRLHIGSTGVSIQMEIVSSVVTSIVKAGSVSGQKDTLADMEKNSAVSNAIKSQIEMLTNSIALSKGEQIDTNKMIMDNSAVALSNMLSAPLAITDGEVDETDNNSPSKNETETGLRKPAGVLGALGGFPIGLSKLNTVQA